ncbi:MAG: ABC transporter permease [Actinomycetota bacterium]
MSDALASPARRIIGAQTRMELRLRLRHGESLLLTMIIPVVLLLFFGTVDIIGTPTRDPVDFVLPGILAVAIMSTAFTGQAIATAYERSYGVLKRLGTTPLPRWGLLASKTLAVVAVEGLQIALLLAVGAAVGWRGQAAGIAPAALLVLLGTVCFSGLGLLMAGTMRPEATLAAANGLYVVLLLVGGLIVPLSKLPAPLRSVGRQLPTAALADGLRAALNSGRTDGHALVVLVLWSVVLVAAAVRFFRWE